jgi:uncharacterized membrane protein YgcG
MKRLIFLLAISVALLAPAGALASGVVLKVQKASHLVAVTRSANRVALVHTSAAARLHLGQRVSMTARTLRNGTLAAAKVRVLGRAHQVRFRGLLLAQSRTRLVVSAGGAVITVHRGIRSTSSARDHGGQPQPGAQVVVTATVNDDNDDNDDNDELDENNVVVVAPMAPGGQLEGHLTIGTGTVTVSSEHMTLVLNVPTGFDLTGFANGDEVLATFTQETTGTLTLTALSQNEDEDQADNDDNDDGDHGGDHGGGGGGGGGGGDDHGGGGGGGHDGHH